MADKSILGRLAAELVVVVLGVMIALAADSWRQSFEEQTVERRYLERLTEDVRQGMSNLTAHRESKAALAASAYELAASMESEASSLADDAFFETLFRATQVGFDPQEFSDVTYQELIASGNFALLRDPEVREGVVEFYRRLDVLVEGLDELQEVVPINDRVAELTGYYPYVFDVHCVPSAIYACGEFRALTAEDRGRLLHHLRQDEQLVLGLRHVHADLVLHDELFANALSVGQELIAELERVQ